MINGAISGEDDKSTRGDGGWDVPACGQSGGGKEGMARGHVTGHSTRPHMLPLALWREPGEVNQRSTVAFLLLPSSPILSQSRRAPCDVRTSNPRERGPK